MGHWLSALDSFWSVELLVGCRLKGLPNLLTIRLTHLPVNLTFISAAVLKKNNVGWSRIRPANVNYRFGLFCTSSREWSWSSPTHMDPAAWQSDLGRWWCQKLQDSVSILGGWCWYRHYQLSQRGFFNPQCSRVLKRLLVGSRQIGSRNANSSSASEKPSDTRLQLQMNVARFLLRDGKRVVVEVSPEELEVLTYEDQKGQVIHPLATVKA